MLHLLRHGVVHLGLGLGDLALEETEAKAGADRGEGDVAGARTSAEQDAQRPAGRVVIMVLQRTIRVDTTGIIEATRRLAASGGMVEVGVQGTMAADLSGVEELLAAVSIEDVTNATNLQAVGAAGRLAPELLDALSRGTPVVPVDRQSSWLLGVLLFQLVSQGRHPLGSGFPRRLPDGSAVREGAAVDAVTAYF